MQDAGVAERVGALSFEERMWTRLQISGETVPDWANWTAPLVPRFAKIREEAKAKAREEANKHPKIVPLGETRALPRTILRVMRVSEIMQTDLNDAGKVAAKKSYVRIEDVHTTVIVPVIATAQFSFGGSRHCPGMYFVSNVIIVSRGRRKLGELSVYPMGEGAYRVRTTPYGGGDGHFRITEDGEDVVKLKLA